MIRKILNAFAPLGVLAILAANTVQAADLAASSAGGPPTDAVITQQIYTALNQDPIHYFRHVDVQVSQGVVTLSGIVWSADSILRAKKIASGVPGVTGVIDQMELERGTAPHA